MTDYGVEIWDFGGTGKVSGATTYPLFRLTGVEKSTFSDSKDIESFAIPGPVWNAYFDNVNVQGVLTLSGKFAATDATWDAYACSGRAHDFIHVFRSILKSIYPWNNYWGEAKAGGEYLGTGLSCFKIKMVFPFASGAQTYDPATYYNSPDGESGYKIGYIYKDGEMNLVGPI